MFISSRDREFNVCCEQIRILKSEMGIEPYNSWQLSNLGYTGDLKKKVFRR